MEDTQTHPDEIVALDDSVSREGDDGATRWDVLGVYHSDLSVDAVTLLRKEQRARFRLSEEMRNRQRVQVEAVEDLNRQLTQARQATQEARDAHQRDIDRIGERLMEEAERRDWCSEYDSIVDQINSNLSYELPVRSKDWAITYTVPVTVTVYASGRDAEAAEDSIDASEIKEKMIEAIRYGYSDFDWSDWEAEESD